MDATSRACENPGCENLAILSKNGKQYLRYCSRRCQNHHTSVKGTEKRKQTCLERFGATTNLSSEETKQKIVHTNLQKRGVPHAMKATESKKKLANTKQQRYGDPAFNNRDKFKETWAAIPDKEKAQYRLIRSNTARGRYGDVMQSAQVKEKAATTNLARYGHSNPARSAEVKQKIANTQRANYCGKLYKQQHIPNDSIAKLKDKAYLIDNAGRSLVEIAEELGVTYHAVGYAYAKHAVVRTFVGYSRSQAEREICDFLSSHHVKFETNVRKIAGSKEIDIYIPAASLGIEYNGLYWHCENRGKDKYYHLDKTRACQQNKVNLVHITDVEWKHKKDIAKFILLSKLGISAQIHAQDCKLSSVTTGCADAFLSETHIQGPVTAKVRYGLYHCGNIVAIMTFAKTTGQWELRQYSSALNTAVVGATSRLFLHFVAIHQPESIVSRSDNRWGADTLCCDLGFTHSYNTEPDYWYSYQYATLESRHLYQKRKLAKILPAFDPASSEWENMTASGYDRFWDCGNSVWLWQKKVDTGVAN